MDDKRGGMGEQCCPVEEETFQKFTKIENFKLCFFTFSKMKFDDMKLFGKSN